jgi:hypothetical protein
MCNNCYAKGGCRDPEMTAQACRTSSRVGPRCPECGGSGENLMYEEPEECKTCEGFGTLAFSGTWRSIQKPQSCH